MSAQLKEQAGVGAYKGESDQFAALGDESGLLLVMKRGRVISFESPERKAVSVFPTVAVARGEQPREFAHAEHPYRLRVTRG